MQNDPQIPDRLWKYRKWDSDGHTRRMITDGELFYAKTEQLNDPLEISWYIRLPIDEGELDLFSRELCAMTFPHDTPQERAAHFGTMKQSIRDLRLEHGGTIIPAFVGFQFGLLCMTKINNDVLMWSHYADHHRGVCVGIRTECLAGKRILKVSYSDDVPLLDCWDYVYRNREMFVDASRTKGLHWQYENEWRTVHHPGPQKYPGCVDRVVIGLKATDETRAAVYDAIEAAGRPIEVFDAVVHRRRFTLDIVPANKTGESANR